MAESRGYGEFGCYGAEDVLGDAVLRGSRVGEERGEIPAACRRS